MMDRIPAVRRRALWGPKIAWAAKIWPDRVETTSWFDAVEFCNRFEQAGVACAVLLAAGRSRRGAGRSGISLAYGSGVGICLPCGNDNAVALRIRGDLGSGARLVVPCRRRWHPASWNKIGERIWTARYAGQRLGVVLGWAWTYAAADASDPTGPDNAPEASTARRSL